MKFFAPLILIFLGLSPLQAAVPWDQVLGPSRGTISPPASFKVQWRDNLPQAIAEAKREDRPLFVTFRCLPCKQCSDFDKQVLEGGSDLDPLLLQFVTVRLTKGEDLDFRIFPVEGFQDLDLSWWGWFLSPQAEVYGIFGGKDHVSESTRISKTALMNTLLRVLKHHYDPRRKTWGLDGPTPALAGKVKNVSDLPGWKSWDSKRQAVHRGSCIHCHQINDILRQPAIEARTFDKKKDLEVWPLPENVGLHLDRDHGLLVNKVEPDSPAARAGLKEGDELGAAGGRRLFSQADFQGVLHRGPRDAGEIELVRLRNGSPALATLKVSPGWRKTILDWRMSVSQGNIGAEPGFFPLAIPQSRKKQLGISESEMGIEPFMGTATNSAAYRAGLRQGDVVTAVDGKKPDMSGRGFLVWFRQQYEPGNKVTLQAADKAGKRREIQYHLQVGK